ncbi:hypothetical protein QQX98_012833 [Neonectria punicea]|uniref:Uncharacterized protein n=1 Tax=Neonectria punicea TaxID=979145 RepID=A0ABR1GHR4_9HYPO
MLLAILGRYIYTRRALVSFRFRYGKSSNQSRAQSRGSTITELRPRQKIYDRWLILRLAVGFVALGIFQMVTIMTEVISQGKNTRGNLKDTADLSLQQAKSDFVFFLPGATPPLVTFIVFEAKFLTKQAAGIGPGSLPVLTSDYRDEVALSPCCGASSSA